MNKFMLCTCGALLAGVSMAAAEVSVTGNNTAVVIQKDVVKSLTSNFQFLCVPVKGFDISGKGAASNSTVGDLLPPATMGANAQLTVTKKGETTAKTYKVEQPAGESAPHWYESTLAKSGKVSVDDTLTLGCGDIFWLQSETSEKTVFCGEDYNAQPDTLVGIETSSAGMVQAGNAGAEPLIISKVFNETNFNLTQFKTRLFVLQNGSDSYKQYHYTSKGWLTAKPGSMSLQPVDDTDVIASGEAFYIQNASRKGDAPVPPAMQ